MTEDNAKALEDILYSDDGEMVMEGDCDYDAAQLNSILEDQGDEVVSGHMDPLQGLPITQQALASRETSFTPDTEVILSESAQLESLVKEKKGKREPKVEILDVLDAFDKQERENMKKTDKQIIQQLNIKRSESRKLPIISLDDIKQITLKMTSTLYGLPTSLAVSEQFILIGTAQGILTQYEQSGSEIRCLKRGSEFGAVTALDIIRSDEQQLGLAGYHNGQVVLWDLNSGASLRASNAIHTCPVLAVKFWRVASNKLNAITSDSRGNIHLLEYSKSLFSVNIQHRALVTGAELGICPALEPLFPSLAPHVTDRFSIVALGSTRKLAIYTLAPTEERLLLIPKPEGVRDDAPIYLSWYRGLAPGESMNQDPLLAVGWERRLFLYRVAGGTQQDISIVAYYELDSELRGMIWLSKDKILVMDNSQEVQVYMTTLMQRSPLDVKNPKARVDQEALYIVQMVSQYSVVNILNKSIMTFHNSLKSNGREVFFLGTKGFHRARLLNWKEAIVKLIKDGCWLEVLSLGLDFYERKDLFVYESPKNPEELLAMLKDVALEYVHFGVQNEHKIPNTIEFCIAIGATDLLFGELFEHFLAKSVDNKAINLFMDSLEPYIIADKVKVIPTDMLGKMIAHYFRIKRPDTIEKLILHLDATQIEPSFILPHCKEYRLTTACIFINTKSTQQSYINALKLLHDVMEDQQNLDERRRCSHKLLWFLRMTIRGETFPSGTVMPDMWPKEIVKIAEWLKSKNHLVQLLEVDSVTPFQVLWLFFAKGKPADVIREHNPTLHSDLLFALEEICKHSPQIYPQYTLFIAKVVSDKAVPIPKQECITVATYLMTPQRQAISYSEAYGKAAVYSEFAELQYDLEKKGNLILNMLKETDGFTTEEIDALLKLTLNTPQYDLSQY